ncbi:MAG: PucR family transcriptional regulator ligand-binding domain-containing protein, partial [Coriobacteriaceae bacterium]|nr:PucR family transcriptional regulator ligand-binding domain-containing protein [Coriobacteriaceae bacterium]
MTVEELLETPLMQGAKLIAGAGGLMNEVTWCSADTEITPDDKVIPRLFLIVTKASNEEELVHRYIDHLGTVLIAGIGYFSSDENVEVGPQAVERAIAHYDELKIPVIKLPRGTNLPTFKKHFTALFSKYYLEQKRRSEWLRELCQESGSSGGEIMARTLGYNSDMGYYGMLIIPKNAGDKDPLQRELEVETVKNLAKSRLSKKNARLLYYMGTDFIF